MISTTGAPTADASASDNLRWPGPQGDSAPATPPLAALVGLRLLMLVCQIIMLLVVALLLHWPVALAPSLALLSLSALISLALGLSRPHGEPTPPLLALVVLLTDVFQTTGILACTGGLLNPFNALLAAPGMLSGAFAPRWGAAATCLAVACSALLLTQAAPIADVPAVLRQLGYLQARALALGGLTGVATAVTVWARGVYVQRQLALRATEAVLVREQRLSAIGALSAALAHELGTPLATITVTAKEMAREAPEGPLRDDALLLLQQVDRCRDILRRLGRSGSLEDDHFVRAPLDQLLGEIIEPFCRTPGPPITIVINGSTGAATPQVQRQPEIIHALAALIDNARDFAVETVEVTARFDPSFLTLEVRDDGPGFAPGILSRLGQPYVSSRTDDTDSKGGLGLGFFIARTLLERTGARVTALNPPGGGAAVIIRWPRSRIE